MTGSLAVLLIRDDGDGRQVAREWHYFDPKIQEKAVEFSCAPGPDRANITIAVSR
jgi:hypothetical protein